MTEEVIRIRRMREVNQESVLLAMCSKTFTSKAIIFGGTKQAAHRLKIIFGLVGLKAAELHGNLIQCRLVGMVPPRGRRLVQGQPPQQQVSHLAQQQQSPHMVQAAQQKPSQGAQSLQ